MALNHVSHKKDFFFTRHVQNDAQIEIEEEILPGVSH